MTIPWSAACLSLFLLSSAAAQTCVYSSGSDPAAAGSGTSALLDTLGAGITVRRHVLVPAPVFQNVPTTISELSVLATAGYRKIRFEQVTIRMGYTSVSQLGTVFSSNITGPLQNVMVVHDHVWTEGFGPAWIPVGLQTPFQFLPGNGNLLIEVVAQSGVVLEQSNYQLPGGAVLGGQLVGGGSILPQMGTTTAPPPRLRFCVDRAETGLFGETCSGSGTSTPLLGVSGRPTPGASPTIWLSDAPANAIAACAYGFDTHPPFPIDLTPLGAPGCRQYFAVGYADVVLANGVGVGQRAVAIPNSISAIGAFFYTQYYVLDPPANALGVTASNYARLLVGL